MPVTVSDLDEHCTVTEYQPDKDGIAHLKLVDGQLVVWAPYQLYTESGRTVGPMMVELLESESGQLADIKSILAEMVAETNSEIESECGWSKQE